jgi:hypothetical protein
MKTRTIIAFLAFVALLVAGIAISQTPSQPRKGAVGAKPEQAQPVVTATVAPAPAATRLGDPATAKWTATTYEAATSEAHKQVLASGKVATVTGEIVDVSCYLQLGKRGEAHVACGTKCIMNGQPIGIVDSTETLTIIFPEEHHPRRDGRVDLRKVFVPLLAKTVTVTGMSTEMHGYRALFVQAAEVGGTVAAPDSAAKK